MTEQFYERDLAPVEIHTRTELALLLMGEQDDLLSAIAEKRREIRALNVSRKKLESRVGQLRREIRSGKALESRQLELEVSPPPDPFAARYPMARDALRLHADLSVALQGVQVPSAERLGQWHPDTGIFQAIAHWARLELAHMNAKEHPEIEIPGRMPMPEKLAELRRGLGRPKPKARKPSRRRPETAR